MITYKLPKMKDVAAPILTIQLAEAVAVVRWLTGNHVFDNKGGPAIAMGPPTLMIKWAVFINL